MEKTVGDFIASLRKKAGLTQKEMARKLNVSDKTVSRWERDENLPDIYMALDIARLFGISVDELIGGQSVSAPAAVSEPVKAEQKAASSRREENIARVLKVKCHDYNIRSGIIRTVPFMAFVTAIAICFGLGAQGVNEWLVAVSAALLIDVSAVIYQIYIASKLFVSINELCEGATKRALENASDAKKKLVKKAMVTVGVVVTVFVLTVCYLHLGDIVEFIYCTLIFAPISVIVCTTISVIIWDKLEAAGKFHST